MAVITFFHFPTRYAVHGNYRRSLHPHFHFRIFLCFYCHVAIVISLYLGINPGPGWWKIPGKALESWNPRHINTHLMTRMWFFMCLLLLHLVFHPIWMCEIRVVQLILSVSLHFPVMCWIIFSFSMYLRHVLSVVSRNDGRMCDVWLHYTYMIPIRASGEIIFRCFPAASLPLHFSYSGAPDDITPSFQVNSFQLWGCAPTEIQTIDIILVTTQI